MIYALSMNPSWDKTASIARFQLDAPNRIQTERLDVGGKGVNVARVAQELGEETELVGFDFAGEPMKTAMAQEGIPCKLFPLRGEMRVNLKLRETETGRTIEINERGAAVAENDLQAVLHGLLESARTGAWYALSGSLPPGAKPDTYRRFCGAIQAWGCSAAVDCDGEALREAVQTKPALIKPNIQEFCELTGVHPENEREVLNACRALCSQGVGRVCLTWGGKGAWLVSAKEAWACSAAKIEPQGTQGGGDTMLAALLTALSRGMSDPEALRFASAAAAATVMRPGTLLCRRADQETLLPGLTVSAL